MDALGEGRVGQGSGGEQLVIVSVGYSACHWCHVMEHETFENDEAAAFMNAHFVSIKVDREERPDVDQVYMDAVQLMTRRGGWPLNCVALPDGRPIWGGTYFPTDRWLAGLGAVRDVWQEDADKVEAYAEQLITAVGDGRRCGGDACFSGRWFGKVVDRARGGCPDGTTGT